MREPTDVDERPIHMRWQTITLVLVVALLVAACAASEDADAPPATSSTTEPTTTAPENPPESGTSSGTEPDGDWVLLAGVPTVDGYPVTLGIDGSTFGGTAACNGYGGTITIGDDLWRLSEFAITQMACEPDVMASESAYVAALQAVDGWTFADGLLTLTGASSDLVFERAPEVPTEALVGTEWILETIVQGEVASTPSGEPARLLIMADGSVSGSTGCRTLAGTWVVRYGKVFFPDFAADGECPPDLFAQDSIVVTVLGDGFTADVDGDVLTVTSMGDEGLVYRAN